MADGDTIPDRVCDRCGSGLCAIRMTVESTEVFCPHCELHEPWRQPIYTYDIEFHGKKSVVASSEDEALAILKRRSAEYLMSDVEYEVKRRE